MSFTKVAPVGIGTEPGSSIRIGDSLLHSTGIDLGTGTGIGVTIRQHGNATFTGIVTASAFYGDGTNLSGIDAATLKHNNNTKAEATASGVTITGNLGVSGVLTYEDVTNVDSIGIVTARSGVHVGPTAGVGATIYDDGGARFSGIVTASSLVLDALPDTTNNTLMKIAIQAPDGTLKSDDVIKINPNQNAMKVDGLHLSNNHVRASNNGPLHLTTANANGTVDLNIKHTHVEINGHLEIANGTTSVNKHSVGVGTTTTAGRNAGVSTAAGTIVYNSQSEELQVYTGNVWASVSNPFEASGGTKSVSSRTGYAVHTFTSPGNFIVANKPKDVEVMIIGGGGGGGEGGGGAGALYFNNSYTVSPTPGTYAVTVGGGGSGATNTSNPGSQSSFGPLTAAGGGRGGSTGNHPGGDGGSGGGSRRDMGTSNTGSRGSSTGQGGGSTNANSPPAGWGHRGGHSAHPTWCGAGGGGGAGGVGGDGSGGSGGSEISGNGGPGLTMSIQGPSGVWAGGGGGGMEGNGGPSSRGGNPGPGGGGRGGYSTQVSSPRPGTGGTTNTGGGGGGTASTGNPGGSSFGGGPGIVIVAYPTA